MLNRLKVEEGLMNKIRNGFETTLNKKPALLIYGSKDPVHEMGISQRIKSMLPYSELHLIEGEAHFPHEGAPNKMARLISNWMVKLNR
jgi:pimeloyl-ACP methyl ester carboxylesterase